MPYYFRDLDAGAAGLSSVQRRALAGRRARRGVGDLFDELEDAADDAIDDAKDDVRKRGEEELDNRSGGAIRPDGTIDYRAALRHVIQDIEIRTTMSPPIVLTADDLIASRSPPPKNEEEADTLRKIKPTLIVRMKQGLGRKTIAPGGVATGQEWLSLLKYLGFGGLAGVVVVGGIFGVGFWLGRRGRR